MADYAATVTLDLPRTERISQNLGALPGKCDLTNYNQSGEELTDITNYFRTMLLCVCEGLSDNGYIPRWDRTDKCFHAFYPTSLVLTDDDGADTAGKAVYFDEDASLGERLLFESPSDADGVDHHPAVEVANDVDVGVINFLAIGIL